MITDMTEQYNTPLSPEEEAAFQAWSKDNNRANDTYDYDLRGWYKSANPGGPGADGSTSGLHLTDKFKKPNHPTFSDQSQYHGVDGNQGGTWEPLPNGQYKFRAGPTNMQVYGPLNLQDYFSRAEKGNVLEMPEGQ